MRLTASATKRSDFDVYQTESGDDFLSVLQNMSYEELVHYSGTSGYQALLQRLSFNPKAETDLIKIQKNFERLKPEVEEAAQKYRIDAALVYAIIQVESGGKPYAFSPTGCKGVMQLSRYIYGPNSFAGDSINPFVPGQAVDRGTHFLATLRDHYHGDLDKMLAEYHSGRAVVTQALSVARSNEDWKNYLPDDAKKYLHFVRRALSNLETQGALQKYFYNGKDMADANYVPSASEWQNDQRILESLVQCILISGERVD